MSYAGGRKAKGGRTADLKGANVVVTAYVNGEPRTQLELLEGFQKIPFGAGIALHPQRNSVSFPHLLVLQDISGEAHIALQNKEVVLLHSDA